MIRRQANIATDGPVALFGVDQKIRACIQDLWMALPRDQANTEVFESHFRRLIDRAIEDFKEDMEQFPNNQ